MPRIDCTARPFGRVRARFRWAALVVAALVVAGRYAPWAGVHAAGDRDDDRIARPEFRAPSLGYHGVDQLVALVGAWVDSSRHVEAVDLGATGSGFDVPALQFGAPGATPLDERRTIVLVGAMDGRSQSGAEAVLHTTHALLEQLAHLDPTLAFLVVPWGAPDALARTHGDRDPVGRNLAPVDDDGDDRADEDPPDDVDGDGLVLDMLLPDPDGPWCFSDDARFLVPAHPGDAPRFVRVREGRDDDGDGAYNEDGLGGVDYDRHFPVGWTGPSVDGRGGRWPLEEEVPRQLADELSKRHVDLAFVFQGAHGGLRYSGADGRDDAEARQRLGVAFERATGRRLRGSLEPQAPSGRLSDWLAGRVGAVVVEVAAWGPEAVGMDGRPYVSRSSSLITSEDAVNDWSGGTFDIGRSLEGEDLLWARWLDDVRGGSGFLDWHPVDLGGGDVGWVGGWEPRTRLDPPEDSLAAAIEGLPRFVQEVVVSLPTLELEIVEGERTGDLLQLTVRVVNRGGLGSEFLAIDGRGHVEVELHAACDAAILAGEPVVELGRLGPGAASAAVQWLVTVPEGGHVRVVARSCGATTVQREVRP